MVRACTQNHHNINATYNYVNDEHYQHHHHHLDHEYDHHHSLYLISTELLEHAVRA